MPAPVASCTGGLCRQDGGRGVKCRRNSTLQPWKKVLLGFDVKALIGARVFFLPASLIHEKSPELVMRFHPKHRINFVFLEHGVPSVLVDLPFGEFEIVTQQSIRVGGRRPAVDEHRYGAVRAENQKSADIPVVQNPPMRKMLLEIKGILL